MSPYRTPRYSKRSASMGSRREARRRRIEARDHAGETGQRAMLPTITGRREQRRPLALRRHPARRRRCRSPARSARPRTASTTASMRNCKRMSRRRRADRHADADLAGALGHRDQHDVHDADAADHAARSPPPPRAASAMRLRARPGRVLHLGEVADLEVGRAWPPRRWRWRRRRGDFALARRRPAARRRRTSIWPTVSDCAPDQPPHHRGPGHQDHVVLVLAAEAGLALGARTPITLQGTCLTRICSPTPGRVRPKSLSTTVWPRTHDLGGGASSSRREELALGERPARGRRGSRAWCPSTCVNQFWSP